MSIWSSVCTFGADPDRHKGAPYTDYVVPATDHYAWERNTPEEWATLPRGGFVDVASSGMCPSLLRLSVDGGDDDAGQSEQVFLDAAQVRALRDALDDWLTTRPPAGDQPAADTPKD